MTEVMGHNSSRVDVESRLGTGYSFWSNVKHDASDVIFMVVKALAPKDTGVFWINEAYYRKGTRKGTPLSGYIAVYATSDCKTLLNDICSDPRITALKMARVGVGELFPEPYMDETGWDEVTKSRILALYRLTLAKMRAESEYKKGNRGALPLVITKESARTVFGLPEGTTFPNKEEIQGFVAQVVEEALVPLPQIPQKK